MRRRVLLQRLSLGMVGALGVLSGCAPTTAAVPTAAPKPTSAPQPTVASAAAASPGVASPVAAPKPTAPVVVNRPTFTIAYTSIGGFNVPLWLADRLRAWDTYGVDVKLTLVEGNAAAAALLGKSVDAILQSAAPVITADVNGGADLVFTASTGNHPVFSLHAAASINTASDLRGKVVATDRPGTPNDYGARALLSKLGLKYADVTPALVGGSANTIAALLSGQAQAAVLTPPESFRAEARGFHQIANIYDGVYQGAGVIMQRSRLDERAPAAVPFLRGLRKGIEAYNDQPDVAMKVLADYSKEADDSIVQKTYAFYKTQAPFPVDLRPTLDGIQGMIDFLAETIPAAQGVKAAQFVDSRYLDQLGQA